MINKKIISVISILFISLFIFNDKFLIDNEIIDNLDDYYNDKYELQEKICYDFVNAKLSKEPGVVYTNYLVSDETLNYSTGYEILSESIGLMMLYAVRTNNANVFDNTYNYMKKNMYKKNNGIAWRVEMTDGSVANSNASIDDLRIIRALIEGNHIFDTNKYDDFINELSLDILNNLTIDEHLISSHSFGEKFKNSNIEIAYLDLYTMKLLFSFDKRWNLLYNNSVKIIKSSRLPNLPLYYKSFNISNNEYKIDSEINMLDSLITMLHLSEVDLLDAEEYDWLKNSFHVNNKLYGHYYLDGEPTYDYESSAVYAIAARIADEKNDIVFYDKIMEKLLNIQIKDNQSQIFGSFGNDDNLEVFSYDNLQSLVAFRRKYDKTSK